MIERKITVLPSEEVHIWSASLRIPEEELDYFTSIISQDEQQRAIKFKYSKDQESFIVSRGILRCILSSYLDLPPQNIEFLYGLWRKPCLPEEYKINFNVSHSKDHALYAIVRNYEIGIDLEYIDNDKKLEVEDILSTILPSSEVDQWKKINSKDKTNSFFKLWVCIEAALKASGKGWLDSKDTINFNIAPNIKEKLNRIENYSKNDMKYPYYFECIPGYASALFINGPLLHLRHFNWEDHYDPQTHLVKILQSTK